MDVSLDLIKQFVKVTSDTTPKKVETTLLGTAVVSNGQLYVSIDGSSTLTPIKTTTKVNDGDRVTVMIKDHTATVTGNITSPSMDKGSVDGEISDQISEFEIIIADEISVQNGKIENLISENVVIKDTLTAANANIENLTAQNVTINGELTAVSATIQDLTVTKLDVETADIKFATIESLNATTIEVNSIKGNFAEFANLTTENFTSVNAGIKNLNADKLSAEQADLKYANIDFANIEFAAIENLFAQSGIIKDLVVSDQHITGELVGVTIKGNLIEAGTLVADKLVVKGVDGLYYKLNVSGTSIESQQTEYNSLNGSIITAKSITATKINVKDLVAFDATIGGFKITTNSIYSGVKSSVNNSTKGIYMDNSGQIAFGDGNNYIKFFLDDISQQWKLAIAAATVHIGASGTNVEDVLQDTTDKVDKTVKSVVDYYAINDDPSTAPLTGWSTTSPEWEEGRYIWSKQRTTLMDDTFSDSDPVCITGAKGSDAIMLNVISSNGHMFKNSSISTTLTVEILFGNVMITSSDAMYLYFGGGARLIWQQKQRGETKYTEVDPNDPRFSDNGFIFTISPDDLQLDTVYNCLLDC